MAVGSWECWNCFRGFCGDCDNSKCECKQSYHTKEKQEKA